MNPYVRRGLIVAAVLSAVASIAVAATQKQPEHAVFTQQQQAP
jgi:hypothetical protein